MTGFGSVIEETLGNLISRRSLIDTSVHSVLDSAPGAESGLNSISNVAQDAGKTTTPSVSGALEYAGSLTENLSDALTHTVEKYPDFYIIGLWNYCEGNSNASGSILTNCTSPSSSFWFNFTEILGLQSSLAEELFPEKFETALHIYQSASKAIIAFYIAGVAFSISSLILGLTATLSRWGSSLTSFCAIVSCTRFAHFIQTKTS